MKKSDIAMIILIASMSALIAFFVANQMTILKPNEKGVKVKVAESIQENVAEPSKSIFNDQAINPTVQTVIGNSAAAPN